MSIFKKSIVLITGGTGTVGTACLQRCLESGAEEVRIFSRNEQKQEILKQKYKNDFRVKFYMGDIKDKNSVDNAMKKVDYVIHAAAMKSIPECEQHPSEALETNINGSEIILDSAIEHQVKTVLLLSTDKVTYPTSMMGLTKACMEKIALKKAKEQNQTKICIVRFCNLLASSGSVIPLFIKQIKNNEVITITDPEMTRFFMTVNQAIDFIELALSSGENGDIFIKKGISTTIKNISKAVCIYLETQTDYPVKIIGRRAGERKHEFLLSKEELEFADSHDDYIVISMAKNQNNRKPEYLLSNECVQSSLEDIVNLIKEVYGVQ